MLAKSHKLLNTNAFIQLNINSISYYTDSNYKHPHIENDLKENQDLVSWNKTGINKDYSQNIIIF